MSGNRGNEKDGTRVKSIREYEYEYMKKQRELPDAKNGAPAAGDDPARMAELRSRLEAAEAELDRCRGTLRMSLDVGRLGSWERDLATNELVIDKAGKTILGVGPDDTLTYEQYERMIHPGDVERRSQALAYALATKTDLNIEHRIIRSDGRIGRVLVRGGAIYEAGRPIRILGVIQDVTEREKAKEEINLAQRRQEFLLRLNDQLRGIDDPYEIMEATARALGRFLKVDCAGYGEVDENRELILVEREWSRGAISNEGRHYRLQDFLPDMLAELKQGRTLSFNDLKNDPDRANLSRQGVFNAVNARTALAIPLLKNQRLTALLYLNAAEPHEWSSDELALIEDVAERTWIAVERARAEAALRESEARFRVIAESLPALVWIIDTNLHLTYANDRWREFSGLPAEDALGDSWMHWIHPDDLARVRAEMEPVGRSQSAHTTEMRYRTLQGEYRWHMIQAAPVHDARGEFRGWCGTSVDIHDLKETEQALRRSEEQLRIALRAAKMGDWNWDMDSDVMTLSERAAEIFGLEPGTALTWTDLRNLLHPADMERASAAMLRSMDTQAPYDVEYRITRASDGVRAWVAAQGQTTFNEFGILSGMTGVVQDITDRKHAEERQQLLIRELHHRVKNTLATVQAIVGSTARTASSIDDFYQGFVGRIVSLARTHNLLTEDLWQKASLEELVQTELGPYEDEARNRVVVEGPSVELPSEAAVPIGMAIHELTTNAAKHGALSTFGGQVEVKWEVVRGGDRPILRFSWTERGGPRVSMPTRQGFGSRLLQRVLATQLQADVNMDFPEDGLRFTMVLPIPGDPPLFNPDK
ncbi:MULTISPECIES: PAS domain-containing protein [Microvirga]|uniref:PAS domain-containing protein n=1 Tax=Microvirga TaxID=186650 RepID=UPI001CFF58A3|nr:PAS domain-containing protein [Microvirga lenta]MCB5176328.1 PAS domain-containing protein [Microvirga lenta]